jgi:hypothetical protein
MNRSVLSGNRQVQTDGHRVADLQLAEAYSAGPNNACESLVVVTSQGDYYVIPSTTLERFCASVGERDQIDEAAAAMVPGTYARIKASEASVRSTFASVYRTTSLAWFQKIR